MVATPILAGALLRLLLVHGGSALSKNRRHHWPTVVIVTLLAAWQLGVTATSTL
ncbi:hypothetical protein ULF88_21695 [Halopseudomonas pachastrellae]|nr:hypothetical protein [Halopseudomonas pachastrellae]